LLSHCSSLADPLTFFSLALRHAADMAMEHMSEMRKYK